MQLEKNDYFKFFEHSQDGILILHKSHFIECNQAAVNMLGYDSKNELLHTHPSKLSPKYQVDGEDSFVKAEAMMQMCLEKGQHEFEWIHQKKSDEKFWCGVVLTKMDVDEKELIHVSWRDITKYKELELRLDKEVRNTKRFIAQNSLYADTIDNYLIVSKIDALGYFTEVNNAFCRLSGYSREELLQTTHQAICHNSFNSDAYERIWRILKSVKVIVEP